DFFAAGVLGLVAAARRYDPARGSFFSFAKKYVWGHMLDGLCRYIEIPAEVLRGHQRIRVQRDRLRAVEGREPTVGELAQAVGCRESTLRHTLYWVEGRAFVSAEAPACREGGEDGGAVVTVGEMLPDGADPEAKLDRAEQLERVLAACDPEQRYLLVEHYLKGRDLQGLTGPTGRTLAELEALMDATLAELRRKFGVPAAGRKPVRLPRSFPRDRFWSNVRRTDACWVWTGTVTRQGYGQFSETRGTRWVHHLAHRASWLLANAAIDAGHSVVQRCGNRACVRPEHLAIVPKGRKARRMQVA